MKKNMMRRNLHQSIKNSITRYIAIVAIIALGAGIFVGLRTTKSDMIATGQQYMDKQNMFDLRLLSSYGWNLDQLQSIRELPGVEDAEGVYSLDVIARYEGADADSVYKVFSIPNTVNQVFLHGGRMPQAANECLADAYQFDSDILGKQLTVSEFNEDSTLDALQEKTYTVVGYASSPLYMDMTRGTTTLGNGSVAGLLFLPEESFSMDYYTEVAVTVQGSFAVYSQAYHDRMELWAEELKPLLAPLAQDRYTTVVLEAEQAYADGLAEYTDGLEQYQTTREETFDELEKARQELEDGQQELEANEKQLEDSLKLIEAGEKNLQAGEKTLTQSKVDLANAKADAYAQLTQASTELMKNYQQINDGLSQLRDGISQIDSGLAQIDSGISQLETGLETLQTTISITESLLTVARSSLDRAQNALNAAIAAGASGEMITQLENAVTEADTQISNYETQLADMKTQHTEYSAQLVQLQQQRVELAAQREQLVSQEAELNAAKVLLDQGSEQIQASRLQAEQEFAAAEAKLQAAELELLNGKSDLEWSKTQLADGQKKLEEGRQALADGWTEYQEGYDTACREFDNAWLELEEGRLALDDARKALDELTDPEVYALDRTTNAGYLALDNNSGIVEGVSAVFPVFFLLIAALVCITTMTRMVEEERTQIGTLKALGYSNAAIIGKYLAYAGTAAVLGCGVGVVAGSIAFPLILWEAYQIIMLLGDYLLLRLDWPLCLAVVGVYTAVTLLVTWYCCRRSLQEVPAELMRPKPPTVGKSIFIERMPFWNRFSFLNKVMLRNIFRYHQRLFMMLVGIGGCTALLLTGFGIRDSIRDLADDQFANVVVYDHEVRFSRGLEKGEQDAFREAFSQDLEGMLFYHQSSMELARDGRVADVNFIAAEAEMEQFIRFHSGREQLSYPKAGQALVSIGMADRYGLQIGDSITLQNADMQSLTLEVAGFFHNNVFNYVVTLPQTVQQQWGRLPEMQMACLTVAPGVDVHELGAEVSQWDHVLSVTVNKDLHNSVSQMFDALDLVVVSIVICAAMLAMIVLYNLTNINITERMREIATIKVLGFRAWETAAYVFKENLLLSVMGSALGLGGGVLLLEFVVSQIQVDFVWITANSAPLSFLWAVVITLVSALLVDLVLYFRLDRINMAEALKSVE